MKSWISAISLHSRYTGRADPQIWVTVLYFAVINAALVLFSKKVLGHDDGAAALWLADSVAIAFLYRRALYEWPILIAVYGFINVSCGLFLGYTLQSSVVYMLAGLSQVLIASVLLVRYCPRADFFDGLQQWYRFALASAAISPLSSATLGSLYLHYAFDTAFFEVFLLWYTADAMGTLILLPVFLLWFERGGFSGAEWRNPLRFSLIAAAAIGSSLLLMGLVTYPFVYVALILLWTATLLSLMQTLVVICVASVLLAVRFVALEGLVGQIASGLENNLARVDFLVATFASVIPAYVLAVYTNIERQRNARITEVEGSFRSAIEDSRIGMLVISLEGEILQVNRSLCHFLGYHSEELEGRRLQDILRGENLAAPEGELSPALDRSSQCMEQRFKRSDGSLAWGFLSFSVARDIHGNALYVLAQVEDIEWRKISENKLLEAKEHLQVTLAAITDAVISTDTELRITYMNPIAEQMTGWTLEEARGMPIDTVCSITDSGSGQKQVAPAAESLVRGATVSGPDSAVLHGLHGRSYDIESSASPLSNPRGEQLGSVLVFQDVSEQRRLIAQLSYKASHDDLTGLPNRDAFKRELLNAIEEADAEGVRHCLVYLDLDRFKVINDSAGHLAGDALLREVSNCLRSQLREGDRVARLGGDEFGLLFRNCNSAESLRRSEGLIAQIGSLRFPWNNRIYDVGASAGVTEINHGNSRLGDLLSQADVACYSAKRTARGSAMVYEAESSTAADQHRELIMASAIQEAIDEQRFSLCLQPIAVSESPEQISHYELLLRMRDEAGQLIMPMDFVPAAERYGLMLKIDRWVIGEVLLRQAAKITEVGISLFINISADALGDREFQQQLLEALDRTPIPLDRIGFEITETAMINQMDRASHFVTSLRRMGCRIALDDFGNGLSSFNYLKAFAIDFIKIDGSFVRQVETNFVDLIIVESIHQVAHRLGARTIAEYVEDEATLERVRSVGVDLVQGYFIGRPLPLQHLLDPEIIEADNPD